MTYQPLHHKYRPQTFADLVGQEAIATTLTNALRQQRIAPAYLFTGARGTGKTSSARILAKSLNCLKSQSPTSQPCGQCEVCRAIANGSALDIIEIDAASNTGVDNIRELIERAQFAPVQCRYKVYVLDEVHMLSAASFNALLKTLEEPPPHVVFVLATTDPQRVLPTIISRCQRFDFRRIPLEAMVQHLGTIADQEGISITLDAITLVAQLSQGGLRDAESLLDQLSLLAGEVTVEKVWDLVGAVPERDLMGLLEAIAQNNPEGLLDTARRLMDRGREPLIVLQNLAGFYRDLLIAKTAPDRSDLVAITPPTWAALCEFAQQLDLRTILAGQQHLRSCEGQLKSTTQPRLWLEVTLMGLLPAALPQEASLTNGRQATIMQPRVPTQVPAKPTAPTVPPAASPAPQEQHPITSQPETPEPKALHPVDTEVSQGQAALRTSTDQASVDRAPRQPEPIASASVENGHQPAAQPNLAEIWQNVITQIQPYSTQVMVRQQCHLVAFDGEHARLGVSSQPLFKMAQAKLPNIEAAFHQVFQRKVPVSLEVAAAPVASSPAPPRSTTPMPQKRESIDREFVNQPPSQPLNPSPPAFHPQPAGHLPEVQPFASSPAPIANTVAHPSPVPELPEMSGHVWHEDETTRAAKQLAEFFAGRLVDMSDGEEASDVDQPDTVEIARIPQGAANWVEAEVEEESDDDIAF